MRQKSAFTLIELLIVVAIIAILAAIAVPNFLEAQTRSKVSRVKADMRSVATAVESYAVDANHYPVGHSMAPNWDRWDLSLCFELTTPIAYLTSVNIVDPFMPKQGRRDHHGERGQSCFLLLLRRLLSGSEHSGPSGRLGVSSCPPPTAISRATKAIACSVGGRTATTTRPNGACGPIRRGSRLPTRRFR